MGTFRAEIKVRIKIIQYVCIHRLITLQKNKIFKITNLEVSHVIARSGGCAVYDLQRFLT